MMKRLFVGLFLILICILHVNADNCDLWISRINQNDTSVCHSSTVNLDVRVQNDSMNLDSCLYEWYVKSPGGVYISQGVSSDSILSFEFTQSGIYFITCKVIPDTCGVVSSDTVSVTVYSNLTAGTIFGDDTICYNTQPSEIQSTALPTGCAGEYVYQWQDSVAGGVWSDIQNGNSPNYQPGVLSETTYYRRGVTDTVCGESSYTQPVVIYVMRPLRAGAVSVDDTICYNAQPSVIQSVELPTGGAGEYVYQWQDSVAGGVWSDITSADSLCYQSGNLTVSTYYRRKVTDTLCGDAAYTRPVYVEVRVQMNAPVISQYTDTLCYDSVPAPLSVTEHAIAGVGDSIRYQWQDSVNGGTWSDIQSATDTLYQPSALQATHYYRVVATSDKGCGILVSNVTEIAVYDELQLSIAGPQVPLCHQTSADVVVSATGAGGRYAYQWQDSAAGVWNNVGTNDSTLSVTAETNGVRYVRCIVTPASGCSEETTTVVAVQTYSALNAGEIIPVDTICYGTQPDTIRSGTAARGCDSVFTYSWEKSIDGETWSVIQNANNVSYQPSALTQSTYYRRRAYNQYCNVDATTNIIHVIVRRDVTAPVVGQYPDTICYNSVPEMLAVTTPSIYGVGDTVRYQWQESQDGTTWSDVQSATNLTYQPATLTVSRYYRVVATSERGCGVLNSNVVKINVYQDLVIVNNPVDTACYMTSTQLTFTAIGEGERYAYQWQESSDSLNFTDIRNGNRSDYWTDDKPEGKYYYRCVVTPKNGCGVDTSGVFVVNVYGKLKPGKIGSNQVVCKNDDASELSFMVLPSGGETNRYTYQWEYSVDLQVWNNVQGATTTKYTPLNMQQTTYYRVRVKNSCGMEYTDTVEILVNPLPDTVIIAGNQNVCINKYEYYEIPEMVTGFDYQWSLDNSVGVILTNPSNELQIRVLWTATGTNANVVLTVTNNETGCMSRNYYPVKIADEITPDTTIIVRKPNSNIFVCQDSITDHYQWGATDRTSGAETKFADSDRRYCQVESGIDTTKYVYWLDMWNGDTARCVSRSIYTPANDGKYIHQPQQNIKVVSSIDDYISIEIENPSGKDVNVSLYSIAGIKLMGTSLGDSETIKALLPVDISSGIYILRVEIGTECETFKLIAE